MLDRIYIQHWLQLDRELRNHLITVFGIPYSGTTEIRDQDIISDGHTNEDLAAITSAKMEDYVGSNDMFPRLWELTIAKAVYEIDPDAVVEMQKTEEEHVPADEKVEPEPLVEIKEEEKNVTIEKKTKQK